MTPQQIQDARAQLGTLWGLGRPLQAAELGRALRFAGRDPGRYVLDMERGPDNGGTKVAGPVSVAVEMMLAGARPPIIAGLNSADEIRRALAPSNAKTA